MRVLYPLLVAALMLPAGDGCGACTQSIEHGLTIEVFNARTKSPLCSADFVITDGEWRTEEKDACGLTTAAERAGTYRIEVKRAHFKTGVIDSVTVTKDSCHVQNQRVEVFLEPLEGDGECHGACGSSPICGDCPKTETVAVDKFQMDEGEVGAASYRAFLRANVAPREQAMGCAANVFADGVRVIPTEGPAIVDWCDAVAYCAWAGKQLCDAPQWDAACAASPPGLRDLGSGQPEWIHSCQLNTCMVRGGSGTCAASQWLPRDGNAAAFRCCSR